MDFTDFEEVFVQRQFNINLVREGKEDLKRKPLLFLLTFQDLNQKEI